MNSLKLFVVLYALCVSETSSLNFSADKTDDKVETLIKGFGYPVDKHYVQTKDNYILALHRIPYGPNATTKQNKVVFFQHGLQGSSADTIFTGPGKALSLILADSGYDVWLGNARGNAFSRNHTTLDPKKDKKKFWDFSFHEIGTIDVPAMIDYVLEQTGQEKLFYIGHSQGTTTFFVMASEKPEYNDKILAQFSMAPSAYMGNIKNPWLQLLTKFTKILDLAPLIGFHEISNRNEEILKLEKAVCRNHTRMCADLFYVCAGFNPDKSEEDESVVLDALDIFPAGSSVKQLLHYSQEIESGKFRQYDHGSVENLVKYGSLHPPKYNVTNIRAPVYLYYSLHDWLASPEEDVLRLCSEIQNCKNATLVADGNYNHLDYIVGVHAPTYVYKLIIDIMNDYE